MPGSLGQCCVIHSTIGHTNPCTIPGLQKLKLSSYMLLLFVAL